MQRRDSDPAMIPVAKRISRLRALAGVLLVVAAVAVGVGSYIGVSFQERDDAVSRFQSRVEAGVAKLDDNYRKMDDVMRLLAQSYTALHPSLSDWPNVALPNFYTSAPLARGIGGSDNVALVTLVKPADLASYEAFMFGYWDAEPHIPPDQAGYYSAGAGDRGVWGLSQASNGIIDPSARYHDTTGNTTWGEDSRIFALSQVLFTETITPAALGLNLYSVRKNGEALDRILACVEDRPSTDCGATTQMFVSSESQDYTVKTDYALRMVYKQRSVPVVVGDSGSQQLVGVISTQYSWSSTLSQIFADDVSGIDIVVRYRGFTFTCRIEEGVAQILGGSYAEGYGDVASKKYAQHKVYVASAHHGSQFAIEMDDEYNLEMTFYPTEVFIADYRTDLPIIIPCCGVMLILLVSLVFVGYDITVRGVVARKEIVLDTKRRFVRFVSHEIRTPMNAVRLGMTLFSTEIDSLVTKMEGKSLEEVMAVLRETVADWRQIAVDVLDNSEAAVDVLNDLLNYDKIESGSLQLEFSMVPVWNVLQRTFKTFVLQARVKDIVFQLQGEMFGADAALLEGGGLGRLHVLGDATRIAQVLRNLLSNSLKFTPKRGKVVVTAEYVHYGLQKAVVQAPRVLLANARAGAVRITVQDDGAGLSPAQVGDICKEGVQFNVNTLQAGGGSGLGLFIGKGIVEQHGGTIHVSSEGLGRGATFVIELPLFAVEESLSAPSSSNTLERVSLWNRGEGVEEEEEEEESLAPTPSKDLLVVDDAASNRKLVVRILTNKGYVCREASDGQQALDVYTQMCADGTPPSAVLMDYEMPVMNGPTAVKRLREMGCDSYIVGVTGNVMQADINIFLQHGANAVLAKPLRIEIFESMMASLVSRKPSTDPRNPPTPSTPITLSSRSSWKIRPFLETRSPAIHPEYGGDRNV